MTLEQLLEEIKKIQIDNKEVKISTIHSSYETLEHQRKDSTVDLQNAYTEYSIHIYYKEGENKLVAEVDCYE